MYVENIRKLLGRIHRIKCAIEDKRGGGTNWAYLFAEDSIPTHYLLKGIKAPEVIQDDFENLAVWTWSLKDYVKKRLVETGQNSNEIEKFVNSVPLLCYLGDIANTVKHGGIDRRSRSGISLMIGLPTYHIPQEAIEYLSFGAHSVETSIKDPTLVRIEILITTVNGDLIGEGFEIIENAVSIFEEFLDNKQLLITDV